jgi:hypothetical protein
MWVIQPSFHRKEHWSQSTEWLLSLPGFWSVPKKLIPQISTLLTQPGNHQGAFLVSYSLLSRLLRR